LKIAERWFERREMGDGITLLYESHVHPFIRCNIWFVRGRDRDLLVDTGTGVTSLKDAIADLTEKPLAAVATHIHYDHVGSLHEFGTRLMHEAEAPRMADYREFAALTAEGFPPELRASLSGYGLDGGKGLLVDALPHEGYSLDGYRVTSTHATGHLKEGDVVDLGDRHFSVFHLPGHSPGSLGLFEGASKTLFPTSRAIAGRYAAFATSTSMSSMAVTIQASGARASLKSAMPISRGGGEGQLLQAQAAKAGL
jgi:glyoxylase-like metal-dependent hydrolase (beta-lactamase superfamily II)